MRFINLFSFFSTALFTLIFLQSCMPDSPMEVNSSFQEVSVNCDSLVNIYEYDPGYAQLCPLPTDIGNQWQEMAVKISTWDSLYGESPDNLITREELDELLRIANAANQQDAPELFPLRIKANRLAANWLETNRDYNRAIEHLEEALQLLDQKKSKSRCDSVELAEIYNLMGIAYVEKLDLENALAYAELSIELNKQLKRADEVVNEFVNIANSYTISGNTPTIGLKYVKSAFCLWENIDKDSFRDTINYWGTFHSKGFVRQTIGDSLLELGNREEAIKQYDRALAVNNNVASILEIGGVNGSEINNYILSKSNTAIIYIKKGTKQYADSIIYTINTLLDTTEKFTKGNPYPLLKGLVYPKLAIAYAAIGKCDTALQLANTASSALINTSETTNLLQSEILDERFYLESLYVIGKVHSYCAEYESGDSLITRLERSLESYQKTLQMLEKMRTEFVNDISSEILAKGPFTKYFAEPVQVAVTLYHLTGETNYLNTAFRISEQGKSFTLRQMINRKTKLETLVKEQATYAQQDYELWMSMENNLRLYKQEGETVYLQNYINAKKAFTDFQQSLKNNPSPEAQLYYLEQFDNNVPSIDYIQSNILDQQTALIEYELGEDSSLAFIILSDRVEVVSLDAKPILVRTVKEFEKSFDGRTKTYRNTAHEAYNRLFAKVHNRLEKVSSDISSLIIIPDENLSKVPFGSLLTSPPGNVNLLELDYLLNEYAITYFYSLTGYEALNKLYKLRPSASELFGGFVASPSSERSVDSYYCNGNALPKLSEMTSEVVKNMTNEQAYLFEKATEKDFMENANRFKIIQLSMHGCLNTTNPLESFLQFHPGTKPYEGKLTVGELYGTSVNASLVVLGNCEAADGKTEAGEGLKSIARAFAYAGCPTVVAPLSSLNDAQGSKVLEYFHKNLQKGQSIHIALRNAKQEYLQTEKEKHPSRWAHLITIGNTNPLFRVSQ